MGNDMSVSNSKDPLPLPSSRNLILNANELDSERLELVTKALGSATRLEILRFLGAHTCSVLEIAEALKLPPSTATLHINNLVSAGLIKTDLRPSTRGLQKVCARVYDQIIIQLPIELEDTRQMVEIDMPLGAYVDAQVTPTCGLAGEWGIIGHLDDPGVLFDPDHIHAQLIWFKQGYLEYRFPNRVPAGAEVDDLEVSCEICSEAPLHHPDWPSDITLWVNGVEVATWTSPADFGGLRGALTPDWWDVSNTQYGLLKKWKVIESGSFVDGVRSSNATIGDLSLRPGKPISVRIGVKDNARNIGGLNIFGKKFGNYPQDLILRLRYHYPSGKQDQTGGGTAVN